MLSANLSAIFYLISGILFILALRGLSSPETSRQGNFFGILGMVIAITVTFLSLGNFSSGFIYVLIFLAYILAYDSSLALMQSLENSGSNIFQGDRRSLSEKSRPS